MNHILISFFVFADIVMTPVIDTIVNNIAMTSFTAVKTVLGDNVCAIYPVPMTTILSISAKQCSLECRRANSCGGFNLRDNDNICELISANNVVFGVIQGCRYFIVSSAYKLIDLFDNFKVSIFYYLTTSVGAMECVYQTYNYDVFTMWTCNCYYLEEQTKIFM